MKSVIICEGSTDYVLLQYFMQKANNWRDYKNPEQVLDFKRARELQKGEDFLIIGDSGGSSRILQRMDKILEINSLSSMGEQYDNIDPEQRYLKKRRYATKAKFDVYFSVRTSVDQFIERRNILKNVQWEKYVLIQNDFRKLSEL